MSSSTSDPRGEDETPDPESVHEKPVHAEPVDGEDAPAVEPETDVQAEPARDAPAEAEVEEAAEPGPAGDAEPGPAGDAESTADRDERPVQGDEPADGHPAEGLALPAVRDEPEPEPEVRRRFLGWSRSPAALLVGVLIGLLGFALAVQVRSNTSTSGLPAARQEDLVRILDDLSSREERLRRQIAELEAARTRLSTAGDRSSTALEEARKRSTALGILAGTVPAQGPGIQLVLTDPRRQLAAEDLLDAVEELRAAGAEAVQVGGVRIGLDSSFVATDRGIAVDGVSLAAPYTLVAIGDPPTLATAMDIPGGVTDTARRAGGDARIEQRDRVTIRVLRSPRTPRYSQPTD